MNVDDGTSGDNGRMSMTPAATVTQHGACGAKRLKVDETCRRPAGWGTPHSGIGRCKLHGGRTATHVQAAERERAERETREQFGKLVEIRPVDNPLEVYRAFAGRVMAWMETADRIVTDLTAMRYQDDKGAEQLRSEIAVFERAMDRANTVLATYARLGIDERLVRVTEQQQQMVVRAVEAALAAAGVAGPAAQRAKRVAASHLRLVGAA